MGLAFEFAYYDIARYLANNCDSEQMIERDIDEGFIKRNLKEYLERKSPIHKQLIFDEEFVPSEWRTGNRGRPPAIDIAMMDGDKVHLAIEIKFLYGQHVPLGELIEDIIRLGKLSDSVKPKTGKRIFCLAGLRWEMDECMFGKRRGWYLSKMLTFPKLPSLLKGKPIKHRSDYYKKISIRKLSPKIQEQFKKHGFEGDHIKVRTVSLFRPNGLAFAPTDKKPDKDNYIDVGIWEVKPFGKECWDIHRMSNE